MQIYNRHASARNKYNNLMQQLAEYMKYKELQPKLRKKIFRYVDFKFQKNIFKESDILDTLSSLLRQVFVRYAGFNHLKSVTFL